MIEPGLSSSELFHSCVKQGILSKEAAELVATTRKRLVKQAAEKLASSIFSMPTVAKGGSVLSGIRKQLFGRGASRGGGGIKRPNKGGGSIAGSDVVKNLLKIMGASAGLGAGFGGVDYAIERHHGKKLDREVKSSYKSMLREFPELIQERNPNMVKAHFGVLRRYAPDIAANPIVAGSFIKETTQQGGIHVDHIKRIVDAQRAVNDAKGRRAPSDRMEKGVRAATTALGG